MVPRPGSSSAAAAAYLPVLDGLRAVSILLVLLSHLGLDRVVPGAFGVTLFFFISGFLITRQLRDGLARHGRIDFAGFYLRRCLRLLPAGVTYIAVAGAAFTAAGGAISPRGWLAALVYGANYYDLFAVYHSTLAGVRHPFNILWSLAIEEHFYVIWPACLALLHRGRRALWALAAICGLILIWRLALWHACFVPGAPWVCGPENPNPLWRYNRLYLATDTRLDSIAWGAMLALGPRGGFAQPVGARGALAGGVLLALAFVLPGPFARYVLRPSLQGAALLGLFPWLLTADTPLHRALRSRPARALGRLSYSLYLWHWAALGTADYVFPHDKPAWVALAVPLSFGLAAASYAGIERPMLRLRHRFGSHAPVA
jgi:peptidoglycan/LPS O-acetylase OafA/YrhL